MFRARAYPPRRYRPPDGAAQRIGSKSIILATPSGIRSMPIFKIATAADWREAERAGRFEGSAHDKSDGFIHFSTGPQLAETLRLYYAGQDGLLLVAVDDAQLGAALKWEHAPSRGEDFP